MVYNIVFGTYYKLEQGCVNPMASANIHDYIAPGRRPTWWASAGCPMRWGTASPLRTTWAATRRSCRTHHGLMKAGVINNSRPKFIPGKTVVGFAFGSKALYEYLDHNEDLYFAPFPVINNPVNIAKNDNMISINTAMSIDLFGQVAAEGWGCTSSAAPAARGTMSGEPSWPRGASPSWPSVHRGHQPGRLLQEPDHALLPPGYHRHHPPVRRAVCGDGVRGGEPEDPHRPGPDPGPHLPGPTQIAGATSRPSHQNGHPITVDPCRPDRRKIPREAFPPVSGGTT